MKIATFNINNINKRLANLLHWLRTAKPDVVSLQELNGAGVPVVLAGDYNVMPTDRDIYPTQSYAKDALVQPESRVFFQRILEQGWVDAIRTLHPDAPMYTFWDYMRNRWPRDAGLRIDHLLLSAQAADHLVRAGVDRQIRGSQGASDHAPASALLRSHAKARGKSPSAGRKTARGSLR